MSTFIYNFFAAIGSFLSYDIPKYLFGVLIVAGLISCVKKIF